MMKGRRFNLSSQINLIFTVITLLTSVLFLLIFNQAIKEITKNQSNKDHLRYHNQILHNIENNSSINNNEHYAYYEFEITNVNRFDVRVISIKLNDILTEEEITSLGQRFRTLDYIKNSFNEEYNNYNIIGTKIDINTNHVLLTVSDGSYGRSLGTPISKIISVGFISIIILGNAIILLWSSVTVEKIKRLEIEVSGLMMDGYSTPIVVEGSDELTDLANTIENMRLEILENERVKQDILQNLSHDIKTPISVIQSYAEAIIDGISEPHEAEIIVKQTEILNRKTKQLLEWNKLEYLKDEKDFELVNIKDVILNVVNNHKYHSDVKFELDLDETKYLGVTENFYIVFSNIIDNALRYAKNVIKVTLKNDKLTFFNDGEAISEDFIDHVFKPYEKGHKGQFGLGMTIVQKTLTRFNLTLTVRNLEDGVIFIIEPC